MFAAILLRNGMEGIQEIVRRTYPQLIETIRDEETWIGRSMTMNEVAAFASGYHAEEYRLDVRGLMSWGVE
jgi:hypothetical protein